MFHYDTTIGYAERVSTDTVHIYGDARTGDGIFTLGEEEIQFRIDPEPTCDVIDGIDCKGYRQRTGPMIFYDLEEEDGTSLEDDLIVTWELAVLIYTSGETVEIIGDATESQWEKWETRIERYNGVYERSGVHIRYELVELKQASYWGLADLRYLRKGLDVDVLLAHGVSYPDTCGVATVTVNFRQGFPPASMSRCDDYTDLHEIGHSVGLAHGPENQFNEASGYIFPDFGHGWNDICGGKDDLMSYGYEGVFHTNERLFCNEVFIKSLIEDDAGNRQFTDTAYHLNRVRYEVSLIHDENEYVEEEDGITALDFIKVEAEYIEIEVID
jgi:hypothetical protein